MQFLIKIEIVIKIIINEKIVNSKKKNTFYHKINSIKKNKLKKKMQFQIIIGKIYIHSSQFYYDLQTARYQNIM